MSEIWFAVEGDSNVGDEYATPEEAAHAYFEEQVWGMRYREAPASVVVMQAIQTPHEHFSAGNAQWFVEQITEGMCSEGGEYAEDDCKTLEAATAELEARIEPVIRAWLRRHVPRFNWFTLENPQTFQRPTEAPK